jgi:hypothetical protein
MTKQARVGDTRRVSSRKILPCFTFSVVAVLATACASDEGADPGAAGGMAGAAGDGGTGGGGGSGTGGGGGTGGGSGAGGKSASIVGSFLLSVTPGGGTIADKVGLIGKVYDAPNPTTVTWVDGASAAGCVLRTPKIPFCEPDCAEGHDCTGDGICQPRANAVNVGKVRVKNVSTLDGSLDFELTEVALTYQVPGTIKLAYPPFAELDTVRLEAAGGAGSAFALEAPALTPMVLTGDTPKLERGQPFTVRWAPPLDASRSVVQVVLNISHHGGTSGKIDCEVPDSGSLTIPVELISGLVDIGVSGWPTVKLTRHASGTTQTDWGLVSLGVDSAFERAIEIPGLESCDLPEDCASGVCRADRTCG